MKDQAGGTQVLDGSLCTSQKGRRSVESEQVSCHSSDSLQWVPEVAE